MRPRSKKLSSSGMSMIELVITVAIMGLIIPAITTLFTTFSKGMSHDEAYNSLKKTNQEALAFLYLKVGTSKRLYQADSNGATLLTRLNFTDCPATFTGMKLPTIDSNGSLDKAATNFVSMGIGNTLVLLAQDKTIDCFPVTNYAGYAVTVSIPTYKIYCFYLTQNPASQRTNNGSPTYSLMEWRSVPLADGKYLKDVWRRDPVIGASVTHRLMEPTPQATVAYPVTYVVDYTLDVHKGLGTLAEFAAVVMTPTPSTNFSSLVPKDYPQTIVTNGVTFSPMVTPGIRSWSYMAQMGGGRTFRHGVASNNAEWQIPAYAIPVTATGFPAGFEVAIVGANSARKVLVRISQVAAGMGGEVLNKQQQVIFCKDVY